MPADVPAAPVDKDALSSRRILSARLATMAYLFCNGFLFAVWGVHIPTVKSGFGLNEAWLSVALLALAAGGILVMAPMGRWIGRVGVVRACLQSGLVMSAAASVILVIPQYTLLVGWLLFYGASAATNDVAANAHGAMLEARMGRPIMGSLHGSFSVGGMLGALSGSVYGRPGLAGVHAHDRCRCPLRPAVGRRGALPDCRDTGRNPRRRSTRTLIA